MGGPSPCLATWARGFWGFPASLPACLPFQAGHQAELLHVAGQFPELLEARASVGQGPPACCWRARTSASPGGGLLQTFCSVLSLQHPPASSLTRVWAFLWGLLANLSHKMRLTAAPHRGLGQLGLTWAAPCWLTLSTSPCPGGSLRSSQEAKPSPRPVLQAKRYLAGSPQPRVVQRARLLAGRNPDLLVRTSDGQWPQGKDHRDPQVPHAPGLRQGLMMTRVRAGTPHPRGHVCHGRAARRGLNPSDLLCVWLDEATPSEVTQAMGGQL